MSTLLERINLCSRDDDPSEVDKPRQPKPEKWEPAWVRLARAKRLPAKVLAG